ncbi:hypothetical protein PPTG_23041 [Phytophthora nicotianae INRA-310]|uniref:Uncharacterized protein n=1 Tax=Phytophthora nicotianae (strain INRA-310) TaxID=761204 RepID=W2Q6U2_PHYN3|nr:hypothetical protein PPTG_23041 [Phytophthora nicotianae INRA-310]ETN08581.1 hypothetical protein PPTG_23041 [Phytophthora nicotianae INRA-310]
MEAVAALSCEQCASQRQFVQTNDALGGVFHDCQRDALGGRRGLGRRGGYRCWTRRAVSVRSAVNRPPPRLHVAPSPHTNSGHANLLYVGKNDCRSWEIQIDCKYSETLT